MENYVDMSVIIEDEQPLYEYWNDLQVVKEIDTETFDTLLDQEIRSAIVDKLAVGIEDEFQDKKKIRHAMSATEIRKALNKKRSEENKINSSNLYFHLQKLEEANLVTVVGQIPTGKRLTTYYGRTAKSFVPRYTEKEKGHLCKELANEALIPYTQQINPDVAADEIEKIIKQANKINESNLQGYKEWIRENERSFRDIDLDFRRLLHLYNLLNNMDKDTFEALQKLSELLKVKQ